MIHPVFYLIMIIMTFYSYMEVSSNYNIKPKIKIPYICMVTVLIFITGTRGNRGADYWPYVRFFVGANTFIRWNQIFDSGVEPTYIIFSKIIGNLHLPFFILLFTFATISISLRSSFYYKFSPYPFFTLLFYYMPTYFFQDSGHIRQGASIAICLFSFQYITQRKLLKFLLSILIAYYFHKTAIIFLPAYWIANIYISTFKAFLLIVLSILIAPLEPYNWFGEIFNSLSADTLSDAYNSYQKLGESTFSVGELVKICFLVIIFSFDKYNIKTANNYNYLKIRNLCLTYYCIYYCFRQNEIFSIRLPIVYDAFAGTLFAIIIKNSKSQINKYLIYSFLIIYLYLVSFRFSTNAKKLNFDKFETLFTDGSASIIIHETID